MAEFTSPGGFVFGVQGFDWGTPRPTSITFFTDGTTRVCDQHGRPIKGVLIDGKEVLFNGDHAAVIKALQAERVEWTSLTWAGWPQIPYNELKKLKDIPPTPIEELRKIGDPQLRKDAIRIRREYDEVRAKELQEIEDE